MLQIAGRTTFALVPLAAGYFVSYLFRNVNAVVAGDIMQDLGIGADTLGLLTSIYFLTFAAAQLPVGVLLDRYGPRRVQFILLLIAAAGAGLCSLRAGLAPLFVGRALIGLGTSGALVAGLKASSEWFPRELVSLAHGLFIMCGGVGALAATWPVDFALRLTDWQGLFAGLAVVAGMIAIAVHLVVPGRGKTAPRPNAIRLADVFRDPLFRRLAPLSAACFGSVLAVQGLWAGPWLSDVEGFARAQVVSRLAAMGVVLIVAAPLWGILTQRLRRRRRLAQAVPGVAMLLMATETLLLLHADVPATLGWCLFAVFGGITVLSFGVLAEHFPPEALGRANGALNVLHIAVSFAVQLGVGQIVALWPSAGGHYPAQAYEAGLLLPLALQAAGLVWFVWPRRGGLAWGSTANNIATITD